MRPLFRFGPAAFVFGFVAISGLIRGRTRFLGDPGTFWHLRLGREILRTGQVPRADFLTSTRAGTPWVDQSWLFDAGLAVVVDHLGWPGAVVLTALILGATYAALTRWLIFRGNGPIAAAATAIAASAVGAIHFLTRPHLFTFAGVLATLILCDLIHRRGRTRWAWALPAVVALWANLHGGFLAGPLIIFTAAGFETACSLADRDRRPVALRFAAFGVLSLAAALLNPYGVGLYAHVAKLLVSSRVTDLIQEYQPVHWGKADMLLLEAIVLGLILLPLATRTRPSAYDLTHALIWLHFGLASVRNVPLFALAVAPVFAPLLDAALSSQSARDDDTWLTRAWTRWLGPLTLAAGVTAAILFAYRAGGPDPQTWPFRGLAALDAQPVHSTLFHEQDWGGFIESESRPARPARIDDRFELWGRAPLLEYVEALKGGPGWDELHQRERFTLVWLRPDRGLARRLDHDPAWRVVHRDDVSVLYQLRPDALAVAKGWADGDDDS